MKKILVSLMLLVMTALSAHAQFEKEVWYVNASLTGLDLSHSKNEGTNFGFALTGGAFVADNVAVLLNFKGNYIEHGMDETSIWCTRTLLFFQLRYLWRIGNGV